MVKVSIIVVTYNAFSFIQASLNSLLSQIKVDYELFIIDNASQDETKVLLKAYKRQYPDKIKLILNDKNIGFARANNLVLSEMTGDYVFSFNPDAVLEQKDALIRLVNFMQNHPKCGLVSAKVIEKSTGKESKPLTRYVKFNHISDRFSNLPGKLAWVIGASILIRADLFKSMGGFCEKFFMYGDDLDLCLRLRQQGYTVEYEPEVTAIHTGGGCENQSTEYAIRVRKQHGLYVFLSLHYTTGDILKFASYRYKKARRKLMIKKAKKRLRLKYNQKTEKYYQAVFDAASIIIANPHNPDGILTLIKKNEQELTS